MRKIKYHNLIESSSIFNLLRNDSNLPIESVRVLFLSMNVSLKCKKYLFVWLVYFLNMIII